MGALPTTKVEIAYYGWVDVTANLVSESGVTIDRGRSSQFEQIGAGTCSFTLKNAAGVYTPELGSTGGLFAKGTAVRITVATYQVFYGFIDIIDASAGGGADPIVTITCTDYFKYLARARLAGAGIEEVAYYANLNSGACWPLSASLGTGDQWAAWRNATASPIRIYGGSAGSHEFTTDGPPFIGSAIHLLPWAQVSPVLQMPTTFNPGTGGWVSFWFKTTDQNQNYLWNMDRQGAGAGVAYIRLETDGTLTCYVGRDSGGGATLSSISSHMYDGNWHHVRMHTTADGKTLGVIVDTLSMTSVTVGTALTIASGSRRATLGGFRNWTTPANSYCADASYAAPAIGTTVPTYTTAAWYNEGANGNSGQSVGTRLNDWTRWVGLPSVSTADLAGIYLSGQDTDNKSVLEAMQDVAVTENGVLYVDRLGSLRFRGATARASGASVTVTIDAEKDLDGSDFHLIDDDSLFTNTVTASGPAGSAVAQDATSVAALGILDDPVTIYGYDMTTLQNYATDRLARRMSPKARLGQVTVDLMTASAVSAATVLQLVPLDRAKLNNLPTWMTAGGTTEIHGFVEHYRLTVSKYVYSVALDMSPVI